MPDEFREREEQPERVRAGFSEEETFRFAAGVFPLTFPLTFVAKNYRDPIIQVTGNCIGISCILQGEGHAIFSISRTL